MNKKLLSILTLALLSIGSAWASTVNDLTTISSATTILANTLNGTSNLAEATLYNGSTILCVGGCGYSEKGQVTYNETKYTPVYQIKNNRQLVLKIGFNATITVVGSTNSSRAWRIGTSSAGNEIASGSNGENYATGIIDGSSTAKTVYINASSDLYIAAIIITANSSPAITAPATTSIKATESGVEATQEIVVAGSRLTGSTLTATLSPAVAGLNVTLGLSTITDGSISTTVTLHYKKTENAKGSTTLRLSDGTTSKDVTVNYNALVVPTELVAVSKSEATTFDLKNTGEGLDDVTPDDYVVLTDAGSEASFADNLAVKGVGTLNVTWRSDAIQAGFFKFKTTVPGTVTVKFSDVGGSSGRPNRYANINGTRSDVFSNSSGTTVTSSAINVNAGEVIIKGEQYNSGDDNYTDTQIRVFTITFTPATTYVDISDKLYRTFASSSALDFSIPVDGLTAYRATVDGDNVSFVEVTDKVPAGEGLLLKATAAGRYYIAQSITTPAAIENALVGTNSETTVGAGTFVLYDGASGVGFYKTTAASFTVGAHTAYLPADASARSFIALDGETTGVSAALVNNEEMVKSGEVYNLSGQRVAQPTKGLYIVNGKIVSIKN